MRSSDWANSNTNAYTDTLSRIDSDADTYGNSDNYAGGLRSC